MLCNLVKTSLPVISGIVRSEMIRIISSIFSLNISIASNPFEANIVVKPNFSNIFFPIVRIFSSSSQNIIVPVFSSFSKCCSVLSDKISFSYVTGKSTLNTEPEPS